MPTFNISGILLSGNPTRKNGKNGSVRKHQKSSGNIGLRSLRGKIVQHSLLAISVIPILVATISLVSSGILEYVIRVIACLWVVGLYLYLSVIPVSYTHLRAHETPEHLVCRLLLEKKKQNNNNA